MPSFETSEYLVISPGKTEEKEEHPYPEETEIHVQKLRRAYTAGDIEKQIDKRVGYEIERPQALPQSYEDQRQDSAYDENIVPLFRGS